MSVGPRRRAVVHRRHAGRPPQGDERDVVLLLPVGAGEPVERVEQAVEQLAARRRRRVIASRSRGKPNICWSGSWASTRPSE